VCPKSLALGLIALHHRSHVEVLGQVEFGLVASLDMLEVDSLLHLSERFAIELAKLHVFLDLGPALVQRAHVSQFAHGIGTLAVDLLQQRVRNRHTIDLLDVRRGFVAGLVDVMKLVTLLDILKQGGASVLADFVSLVEIDVVLLDSVDMVKLGRLLDVLEERLAVDCLLEFEVLVEIGLVFLGLNVLEIPVGLADRSENVIHCG